MRQSNQQFQNINGLFEYKLNKIAEDIKDAYFPFAIDLWHMLNLQTEEIQLDGTTVSNNDAEKSFMVRLNLAIKNYSELFPVQKYCDISELKFIGETDNFFDASRTPFLMYEFESNFEQILDGKLDREKMILLPLNVYELSYGNNFEQHNSYWRFDKNLNRFYCRSSIGTISYIADCPMVYEFSPTGGFTDESAVFLVQYPDTFFNIISLHILRHVDELLSSMQTLSVIPVLNLKEHLARLEQDVQSVNLITAASGLSNMW